MTDTIERQAAIDAICNAWCGNSYNRCIHPKRKTQFYYCDGCYDVEELEKMPSAEPDIIHCKDCAHYSPHKDDYMCGINVLAYVRDDDFCSRAERREPEYTEDGHTMEEFMEGMRGDPEDGSM